MQLVKQLLALFVGLTLLVAVLVSGPLIAAFLAVSGVVAVVVIGAVFLFYAVYEIFFESSDKP